MTGSKFEILKFGLSEVFNPRFWVKCRGETNGECDHSLKTQIYVDISEMGHAIIDLKMGNFFFE